MSSREIIINVRERVGVCEARIESQRLEIAELRSTVKKLLERGIVEECESDSETSSNDGVDTERNGESGGPLWDGQDKVFRCTSCGWEIVDSFCQGCYTEFERDTEHDGEPSVWTVSDALHSDRSRTRRGTTPTIEVGHFSVSPAYAASPEVPDRSLEYYALISRGANQLMCETFNLEYTVDGGIFAWADGPIYTQFSGPAMQEGDFWKIYLGRRVELEEHDSDGSQFIEGLLEDVLLYPLWSSFSDRVSERWETVEESPGIWVTRPMVEAAKDLEEEDLSSDGDEYDESGTEPMGLLGPAAENTRLAKMEDEELVVPRENTGPVAQVDPGYESDSSDEEGDGEEGDNGEGDNEEDDDEQDNVSVSDDLEFYLEAGVPDREWVEDSDEVEYSDDESSSDDEF